MITRHPHKRLPARAVPLLIAVMTLLAAPALAQTPPPAATQSAKFIIENASSDLYDGAIGFSFDRKGRMYVWEKKGMLWIEEGGKRRSNPIVDIQAEVASFSYLGLFSVALSPTFEQDHFVYLFYSVDTRPCQASFSCTPPHEPWGHYAPMYARVLRYRIDADRNIADQSSRTIIFGATPRDGCPITESAHAVGTVLFGEDGSLLFGCGDGGTPYGMDTGSHPKTAFKAALEAGSITKNQNIGAYRAQMLSSPAGKLLRVDPNTGLGMPDNPFFDKRAPGSARSKIWALGLRYPFRMSLRPHSATPKNPVGALYVGDVGWDSFEELDVVDRPGQNFGWPLYEGPYKQTNKTHGGYYALDIRNPESFNACEKKPFLFRDLIDESSTGGDFELRPRCAGNSSTIKFHHSPPALSWSHREVSATGDEVQVRRGPDGFEESRVPGVFGVCVTAGVWNAGDGYPEQYRNRFFAADFIANWIRSYSFDPGNQVTGSELFMHLNSIVMFNTNPLNSDLYFLDFKGKGSRVHRVRYAR